MVVINLFHVTGNERHDWIFRDTAGHTTNLCGPVWDVVVAISENRKKKTRQLPDLAILSRKHVPTCSLSILSWFISLSFFWSSSCCCWISSKCSNKSWRKWVTWLASVLWFELSWTNPGSGDNGNGDLSIVWTSSFSNSLLLSSLFKKDDDFERKTRVKCFSDLAPTEVVGDLLPEKVRSEFTCICSIFPLEGKSVVITIWQTLLRVLSNTDLKLFRFIRYNRSHDGPLFYPCDINMANNMNARRESLGEVSGWYHLHAFAKK